MVTKTMMTVPLLDLRVQYDAIRTEIDDAIRRVITERVRICRPHLTGK